jgi:hypothetical protein
MTTPDYREAATALWGDAGTYVHDTYRRFHHLLPELPDSLPIVIGITAYGKCAGLTRANWTHGPRISIASNLFQRGTRAVDDVMIHEMLHAWLYTTGKDTGHDSNDWYEAINRLSPAVLGQSLDLTRGAHRKSVRIKLEDGTSKVRKETIPGMESQHKQAATWPHPFRPDSYNWGSPIPCPSY